MQNFPANNESGWGFIPSKAKSQEKRLNISVNFIMQAKSKKTLWFVFHARFASNRTKEGTEKGNSRRKPRFYYSWCVPQDLLHLRQTFGSLIWVSMTVGRRRVKSPESVRIKQQILALTIGDDLLNSFATISISVRLEGLPVIQLGWFHSHFRFFHRHSLQISSRKPCERGATLK